MNLSRYEKETVLLFNEEESTAIVGTYNERLKKRLSEFSLKSADCCLLKEDDGYAKYQLPKSWIKVNMPRQYSEEQLQKMAERAKENLGKR